MKSMVAVPVLSVLQALIQRASGANAETLETTSGNVQGQIASGTNGVSEYLGIPYVCSARHVRLTRHLRSAFY